MECTINELKAVSIALAIFSPLTWAITYLFDGLKNQTARIYLFILMLAASFTFFMSFANFFGFLDLYTMFFPLHAAVALSLFPLFYLYVKSLTGGITVGAKNFKSIYIHFIFPICMFFFYVIFQKFFLSKEEEILFIKYILDLYSQQTPIFQIGKLIYSISVVLLIASSVIYLYLSIRMWKQHLDNVHNLFPENPNKELKWVKTLFIFLFIQMIFFLWIHITTNRHLLESPLLISVSYLSFAMFFWFLGLYGFRQQEIFIPEHFTIIPENNKSITKEQFEEFIQKHKPHRRTHISAFDFCLFFQITRVSLTEFLQKEYNTTFKELMNKYRAEDAEKLINTYIQNNQIPDLNEISHKTGFESTATFQKVFKQYHGISVKEYINKHSLVLV